MKNIDIENITKINNVCNQLNDYKQIEIENMIYGNENHSYHYIYFGTIEGNPEIIVCNERCIPDYFKVVSKYETGNFIDIYNEYLNFIDYINDKEEKEILEDLNLSLL